MRLEWLLVAAASLGLRLWLVANYGPLTWPDSGGYVSYAGILLGTNIADILAGHVTLPSFRSVGYTGLLAVLMYSVGDFWLPVLMAMQICTSMVMLWWLYRLGFALTSQRWLAAAAAGLFTWSHIACYDIGILTDALFTHVIVVGVSALLVPLVEGRHISVSRAVCCGLLLAVSMTIREATIYFLPIVAAALSIVLCARQASAAAICRSLLLLSLPVILVWQGYLAWNQARIGARVATTVGQSVYLLHPLELELGGTHVLLEPRLHEAFKATEAGTVFNRAQAMNLYMEKTYGLSESELYFLSEAAFWTAWKVAPAGMLLRTVAEFPPQYAMHMVSLTAALRDAPVIAGASQPDQAKSLLDWKKLSAAEAMARFFTLGVVEITSRLLSLTIFIAHAVGVPLLVVVKKFREALHFRHWEIMIFSWLFFFGIIGIYAMVHLEPRYYMPGQAFAILSGLVILHHIIRYCLRRTTKA